ncbi:MAG: hypothetical protein K9I97_00890 [Cryomorphaceae bacterium]|nr:hypothetical protein [Cryomorphaceae bacterium]
MRFYTQSERIALSTLEEVIGFEQIQSEQTALFNAWIESNSSLLAFLQGKEITRFKDSSMLLKNAMLSDFKGYSAHFLPKFEPREDDFWGGLTDYVSYFCVVDSAAIKAMLPHISQQIIQQNDRDFPPSIQSEQAYNQAVYNAANPSKLEAYQAFPKEWEVLRIDFIERALQRINSPLCSSATAGFMLSKLRSIPCPEAVKGAIDEAWIRFQKGQLNIQKKDKKKGILNRPLLVRLSAGVLGIVVVFFIVNWIFARDDGATPIAPNSSLVYFTRNERIFIDTTLKRYKPLRSTVSLSSNSTGLAYQIRQAFVNKKGEALYTSLSKGLNDFYYNPRPLKDSTVENTLEGTSSLTEFDGKAILKCKNASAYDVLLIAFNEQTSSPVYSLRIRTGTTEQFQLSKGTQVLILPGKEFSGSVHLPFNVWDYNFDQGLQQVYTFGGGLSFAVVFRGDWGEEFSFTNPYQCFKLNP